jgi:hypothetical protein
MKASTVTVPLLFAIATLAGCATDPAATPDELDDLAGSDGSCPSTPTKIRPSMVVTDPVVLAKFPFKRTMQQLLTTAGATGETTKSLYQSWMATFGPTDCTNTKIDPNHYGEVCPRPDEFKLASVDPTNPNDPTRFVPVGLFDRFDLAPKNGANCGEYRVVYAMKSTAIAGRGFYIFEATLPNPSPEQGLAGCLPIAEFWQGLSKVTSSTTLASKLEKFYYLGTAIPNVAKVVDAHNYGLAVDGGAHGTGQIRSNMFIDSHEWHLREFKATLACVPSSPACTLSIDHVTAKTNPANELFDGTHAKAPQFLSLFPAKVKALVATDDVSTIGMSIQNQFNEFESVSQRLDVDYQRFTDAALTQAIQNQLVALGSNLTPAHVLRRATTQTCAGCHAISPGSELGTENGGLLFWPASLGFVQIDETSNLSDALQSHFLPHRRDVLDQFIAAHCGAPASVEPDDGFTIGGSLVGAAN